MTTPNECALWVSSQDSTVKPLKILIVLGIQGRPPTLNEWLDVI